MTQIEWFISNQGKQNKKESALRKKSVVGTHCVFSSVIKCISPASIFSEETLCPLSIRSTETSSCLGWFLRLNWGFWWELSCSKDSNIVSFINLQILPCLRMCHLAPFLGQDISKASVLSLAGKFHESYKNLISLRFLFFLHSLTEISHEVRQLQRRWRQTQMGSRSQCESTGILSLENQVRRNGWVLSEQEINHRS